MCLEACRLMIQYVVIRKAISVKTERVTVDGQSPFHLGLSDGGRVPALVALHIFPPDNSRIVLHLEDLDHIQVSRLVCLKALG